MKRSREAGNALIVVGLVLFFWASGIAFAVYTNWRYTRWSYAVQTFEYLKISAVTVVTFMVDHWPLALVLWFLIITLGLWCWRSTQRST